MNISGSVALVSGANRGLGRAFARELVRRDAAKVYGAARDPAAVTEPGVLPVALDITDGEQVARVAAQCADVSLLVNNAGVLRYSTFTSAPDLDAARQEMEVNYFGTLRMCRAFAPVLAAAGGGAIVNMLSITSFFTNPFNASYGASKAAEWSLTNGVRIELHHQGTLVVAVHAGFIDTDMAALTNEPKISPESVAQQVFDAVEAGQVEVLADQRSRDVKANLSRDHELIYPPIQEFWDAAVSGTQLTPGGTLAASRERSGSGQLLHCRPWPWKPDAAAVKTTWTSPSRRHRQCIELPGSGLRRAPSIASEDPASWTLVPQGANCDPDLAYWVGQPV